MSSALKDARWTLAWKIGNEIGLDFYEIGEVKQQTLLASAAEALKVASPETIQQLAAESW